MKTDCQPGTLPDLENKLDEEICQKVPHTLIHRFDLFPVHEKNNILYVAVAEMPSLSVLQKLSIITGMNIRPLLVPENAFRKAMKLNFGIGQIKNPAKNNDAQLSSSGFGSGNVVNEVDYIIDYAVNNNFSDIHFEPLKDHLRIRIRKDGYLSTLYHLRRSEHQQYIARLKVMAHLDIAEKRSPQDGHISYKTGEHTVDIRVSSMPTNLGEKVVLRILDKSNYLCGLDSLGFDSAQVSHIRRVMHQPHGLFIVTGPTGCGKSTTLYAAINYVNAEDVNIITIEDPIEYNIEGITQVRARPELGFTFAKALRTFLRQDPDIIMVGEIRDAETASIAMRAALTGHLVLTTMHTNDAVTSIFRLLDLGVEPFLICSTLKVIIAQRLIRVICPDCKEKVKSQRVAETLPNDGIFDDKHSGSHIGAGCYTCDYSGFKGRTVIAELLGWTDQLSDLTISAAPIEEYRNYMIKHKIMDIRSHGRLKVLNGISTTDEVFKATGF